MNQLDTWASRLSERRIIEEFLEWLKANPPNGNDEIPLIDIHFEKELDKYHEIDRHQLDKERQGLLDEYQRLTQKPQNEKDPLFCVLKEGDKQKNGDEYCYRGEWHPIPVGRHGEPVLRDAFVTRRRMD